MTVSQSTATCERDFSCVNREKMSLRSSLREDTLDNIMRINIDDHLLMILKQSHTFQNGWTTKTTRRIEGHKQIHFLCLINFMAGYMNNSSLCYSSTVNVFFNHHGVILFEVFISVWQLRCNSVYSI